MGFFPYVVKHGITEAIGSELVRVHPSNPRVLCCGATSDARQLWRQPQPAANRRSRSRTSTSISTSGPGQRLTVRCHSCREQTQVSCAPFMDNLWFCFGAPPLCHHSTLLHVDGKSKGVCALTTVYARNCILRAGLPQSHLSTSFLASTEKAELISVSRR
jgi:hypothetical protein